MGYGRGIDHWTHQRFIAEVSSFMKEIHINLNQSNSFQSQIERNSQAEFNERHILGMILLIRTTHHKKVPR